jgi:hypothetical protein
MEYRKPFEDMGIASEDTQPSIAIGSTALRPPAKTASPPGVPRPSTVELDSDAIEETKKGD